MEFIEGLHDHSNCNIPVYIDVAIVLFANKEVTPLPHLFRVYYHGAEGHAIPSLSPVFEQLIFPLLFPWGESGWQTGLMQPDGRQRNTLTELYYHWLAIRRGFSPIHNSLSLLQEYPTLTEQGKIHGVEDIDSIICIKVPESDQFGFL